jgi:pyruvate,water dikinase
MSAGLPVPNGFVVTTAAYEVFMASLKSKNDVLQSPIPQALATAIENAHHQLHNAPVAVRSSATAEDQPDTSFAGQQDTCLNVQNNLLDAIKTCWRSGSMERAIAYRQQHGIANSRMAVVVQTMVPDVLASGVLFTSAVSCREQDDMLVNAAWGLGQAVVDGKVTPDAIRVDKQSLEIVQRETAIKTVMTVLDDNTTRQEAVPKEQQDKPVLTDELVKVLAKLGQQVEDHYTGTPMDVE